MSQTTSDVLELLHQAQQGDQTAFAALIQHYKADVDGYLRRRKRIYRADEREMLSNEVWFVLWKKRSELSMTEEHQLKAWLYRTAHNKAKDYKRKVCRWKRIHGEKSYCTKNQLVDSDGTMGDAFEYKRNNIDDAVQSDLINHVMSRLQPREQEVIRKRYLEGWSYEEIASSMNISKSRTMGICSGAVKSMREAALCEVSGNRPEDRPCTEVRTDEATRQRRKRERQRVNNREATRRQRAAGLSRKQKPALVVAA